MSENNHIADFEESYLGYAINIINNPDSSRGGYEYTVSTADSILVEGLDFDFESALQSAKVFVGQQGVK